MTKLPRRSLKLMASATLLLAAGCAGSKTFPVEGVVLFKDGKPLGGGIVMFELIGDGPAKVCARGEIQPDGTFRLSTYAPKDGALPGRHRVWVTPPLPSGGEGSLGGPVIDPRFASAETSGLEYPVERGKNKIRIEIDRPRN